MTNENEIPRKTVTYKVHLPVHPRDWTLDTIRQFVKDADAQGIPGDTHIVRFPENDSFSFVTDQPYYGLGVERIVDAGLEDLTPAWTVRPEGDDANLRIIIRYYDARGQVCKFGAYLPEHVEGPEFCIDMRAATAPEEPNLTVRDAEIRARDEARVRNCPGVDGCCGT